jgi:catechol 2,3-dioxygenase-like lactoylglutathione lyase family enzyme
MLRRTFLALFVFVAGLAGADHARVTAVDSIGLTVSDLDRSVEFYSRVLHFRKVSEREFHGPDQEQLHGVFGLRARTARLQLGDEFLELTEFLTPQGRPAPQDSRSNDRWFQHVAIIVSDMDRAYQSLRENKVQHVSPGPQRLPDWNRNAGGIRAFYFRDPDGHPLEVLWFPEGKGDPKWRRSTDRLFLGIDHTAIVIKDTETSLRFYRDVLGMRVAGESENYGPEQERLNNVFGARLRITALRAEAGPGIEFLEYLTPHGGRPRPLANEFRRSWRGRSRPGLPEVEVHFRVVRTGRTAGLRRAKAESSDRSRPRWSCHSDRRALNPKTKREENNYEQNHAPDVCLHAGRPVRQRFRRRQ